MLKWAKGGGRSDMGPPARALTARDLADVDSPVIALYGNDPYQNLKSTFLAQLLTHRTGEMVGLYAVYHVKMGGPAAVDEKEYRTSLGRLKEAIASCSAPPKVLVGDRRTAERLQQDLAGAGAASVVYAPLD